MEESALVWRTAPWCGGERPSVEEGALVWRTAPCYGGKRSGVEWDPWCGEGRPGVDEDAWMPLERGGWRARFGGERL